MSERKKTNACNEEAIKYLKLQIISVAVYISMFLFTSAISLIADIKTDYMFYVSLCFIGLSSLVVGFISAFKERRNGIFRGVLGALPLNVIFIILSLVLSCFKADLSLLITVVVSLIMAAVGGIISVNIRLK